MTIIWTSPKPPSAPLFPKKELTTEASLQKALLRHFDWTRNHCFCNAKIFAWESDMLVVSPSGYVTEIELKTSLSDWRRDEFKSKWSRFNTDYHWKYIKNFAFVVPEWMIAEQGMPKDLHPNLGVLTVAISHRTGNPVVNVMRPMVSNPKAKPLSDDQIVGLYRSCYFKLTDRFLSDKK